MIFIFEKGIVLAFAFLYDGCSEQPTAAAAVHQHREQCWAGVCLQQPLPCGVLTKGWSEASPHHLQRSQGIKKGTLPVSLSHSFSELIFSPHIWQ
jgi:hypothetical protein